MMLLGPLVVTIFYLIQLVRSSSRPENAPLPDEWLLRELNGGHLRLSATVVCCLIKLINAYRPETFKLVIVFL